MLPYFLGLARDWRAVADSLRAAGVPEGDAALTVWREAAWCHLMFAAGRHDAALARLRMALREVTGLQPEPAPVPASEGDALAAALELFERLRDAVAARFPGAFARPAAA
jgi:hypothetical protein